VVLVTGASGFLGAEVTRYWRERGAVVRTFQRGGGGLAQADQQVPLPDLFDRETLRAAMAGVDTVIHLAARVHQVRDTAPDPVAEFRRVNVEWTTALAREAVAAGVRSFFFASSVKALGEQQDAVYTDQTPPHPGDGYGRSKREAELVLPSILAPAAVRLRILRFPLLYGAGMRANMLRLFQLVDRGWVIPVGGIDNRRSILYLENAVSAITAALAAELEPAPYLVSDGPPLATEELVRLIAESLGKRARLMTVPIGALRIGARIGDLIAALIPFGLTTAAVDRLTGSLVVDDSRFRRAAGWSPPCTTRDGLARTAAWLRSRRR
jgi:nucleoside-diphosphate-sugar epimerase